MELVIVERVFDEPLTAERVDAIRRDGAACYRLRRVKHVSTYLSKDGRRTICTYEAPDAAAVRDASDEQGVPYERIWTATVLTSATEPDE